MVLPLNTFKFSSVVLELCSWHESWVWRTDRQS